MLDTSTFLSNKLCKYFGICGGCSCLDVPYSEQVVSKQNRTSESLCKIFPELQFLEPVTGPQFGYRSRARFRYSKAGLSFFEEKSNTPVILDSCPVLVPELNDFLRNPPKLNLWELEDGQLSCITTDKGVVFGDNMGWITVKDKKLPVTGNVFFQSNVILLPRLIDFVVEHTVGTSVMDLYSGIGTFSAFLEDKFNVTAVEINKNCLGLARQHLKKTKFFTSPVEKWRPTDKKIGNSNPTAMKMGNSFPADRKIDTIIIDPPRVGLERTVPSMICSWKPQRIIYVSCYLNTMLRDLERFKTLGYTGTVSQLFDFYPNTPHTETVVVLDQNILF